MKNPIINQFKYTWKYSPNRFKLVFFIVLEVIGAIVHIVPPYVIGKVFNSMQLSDGGPDVFFYLVKNLILITIVLFSGNVIFNFARIIERRHAFLTRKNYRNAMFNKVLDLPVGWHKDHHSGDTIDKIAKASGHVRDFSSSIFMLVRVFILFFGSATILFLFDWQAMTVAFLAASVAFFAVRSVDKKLSILYKKIFRAENFLASAIHDYVSNIITVVTLRLKKRVSKEIDIRGMKAYEDVKKASAIDEIKWFFMGVYMTTLSTGIVVWSAYNSYRIGEPILIGTLYILYGYLGRIHQVFNDFTARYSTLVRWNTAMDEAEILTDAYNKLTVVDNDHEYSLPENWKTIQIKNLYFSYKKGVTNTNFKSNNIHNATISIGRGQKIALIGESGSGKSTILSLIRGVHEPEESKVYIDGKKVDHGLEHLYEHTTLIPQDPEIFNTTIKDNITMGIPAKKEEINHAMALARFTNAIKRLKKGINSNVMEKGVSLSGGEKQRLALSRGLLVGGGYDILLLDEPTSSVDSENELAIYRNIFDYHSDKTILSAVHRLHLLKYFDYIYFWDNGKIIAEGTFNTLMNDSKFKKLWEEYSKNQKK